MQDDETQLQKNNSEFPSDQQSMTIQGLGWCVICAIA